VSFASSPTCPTSNVCATVNTQATVNTFFLGILPQFATLQVNSSSQSTRAHVIMTLVLDRSGSMTKNGGAAALPPAVNDFLPYFDNNNDHVSLVSFSSGATLDFPIGTNFITPITNAMNAMVFNGATFSPGGLAIAQTQEASVAPVLGSYTVQVVVFFTDGYANTIQQSFSCPAKTTYNFGGNAPIENPDIVFFDPTGKTEFCYQGDPPGISIGTPLSSAIPISPGGCPCNWKGGFNATEFGPNTYESFTRANITAEAQWEAVNTANAMRGTGVVVYSIGLGNLINEQFLQQVANDPASPTFDASQPVGEAIFAPDASQLHEVFQQLAAKIILRLTQ
jgi:hypothetical protein